MSQRFEDCSSTDPRPYIRATQAGTSVGTIELLAELFDNSIDAGATVIEATVRNTARAGQGLFCIADNGSGAPSLATLMRLASSDKTGEQTIGRFGVGAKDCIYGVGGIGSTLDIESKTRAGAWLSSLRWATQNSWMFPCEDCSPDAVNIPSKTGLRLTMSQCHRKMPSTVALKAHVARVHWPWLEQPGNCIKVNGETVSPPEIPDNDERFDGETVHEAGEGRTFTVFGGVLSGQSDLNGVTVFCGNRSVYVADAIGTGDYSRGGIFILVRLQGRWSLDRNKNGLDETDAETLSDALEGILAPLLEEASERMRELDDFDLLDRLNDAFAGAQGGRMGKPRRPNRNDKPERDRQDKEPGGTERAKVGEAAVVSGDGSAQERKSRRRSAPFRIDFVTGEHDTIGKVDGPNRRISLHRNNPSVAEVKARQNDEALLFFAASLLADYQSQKDKGQLPFSCRFASLVATILSRGTAAV